MSHTLTSTKPTPDKLVALSGVRQIPMRRVYVTNLTAFSLLVVLSAPFNIRMEVALAARHWRGGGTCDDADFDNTRLPSIADSARAESAQVARTRHVSPGGCLSLRRDDIVAYRSLSLDRMYDRVFRAIP